MSLRVRVTCLRLGGASPTLGTSLFDTCAPWGLGARLLAICWRSSDYASAEPSPARETGSSQQPEGRSCLNNA